MGVIKRVPVKKRRLRRWAVLAALVAGFMPILLLGAAANPNALWTIVHDQCVPDQTRLGHPAPCAKVDLARGYVLLKDLVGATQYLLLPIARITGIESPVLLQPQTPNFFADAWAETKLVDKKLGQTLPRQDLSLAVNSIYGRTQNQLHIHIDCIAPAVAAKLSAHIGAVGPYWSPFPVTLAGYGYEAIRIDGARLGGNNPFMMLAHGLPAARRHMGQYTLVLVGATFPDGVPGFILLADRANLATGDRGSGEALQDHRCAIAH